MGRLSYAKFLFKTQFLEIIKFFMFLKINDCLLIKLCLLLTVELPGLLCIPDISEALLHIPNGIYLLCRLVVNSPDSFQEGVIFFVF